MYPTSVLIAPKIKKKYTLDMEKIETHRITTLRVCLDWGVDLREWI